APGQCLRAGRSNMLATVGDNVPVHSTEAVLLEQSGKSRGACQSGRVETVGIARDPNWSEALGDYLIEGTPIAGRIEPTGWAADARDRTVTVSGNRELFCDERHTRHGEL